MLKNSRIILRVSEESKSYMESAAAIQGKSLSEFIRDAAADQARLIVLAAAGRVSEDQLRTFASVSMEKTIASITPSETVVSVGSVKGDNAKKVYSPFD